MDLIAGVLAGNNAKTLFSMGGIKMRMNALFTAMRKDPSMTAAVHAFGSIKKQSLIYGLSGTVKNAFVACAFQANQRPTVFVTGSREETEQFKADLMTFLPAAPVLELPVGEISTFQAAAKSLEIASMRMDVLSRLFQQEKIVVVATIESIVQKVLSPQDFSHGRIELKAGEVLNREVFLTQLVHCGYERVDEVSSIGQFCARGGIIDFFALNHERPIRLELFGDEIDSLREFEPETQRSLGNLSGTTILPVTGYTQSIPTACALSYLPPESTVIFSEPARIREGIAKLIFEEPLLKKQLLNWQEITAAAQACNVLYVSLMLQKNPFTEPQEIISVTAKNIAPFHRQMEIVAAEMQSWRERDFQQYVFMSSRDKAEALQMSLKRENIETVISPELSVREDHKIVITDGALSNGFELPHARLVIITEKDILGRQKKKRQLRQSSEQKARFFRDLRVGDYVVHVNHGVGKYAGVETLEIGGVHKDYFLIRYAGADKIYVPTDQVYLLQKYIGSEGDTPRLNKMGGSEWSKAKNRAKSAVADLAQELLLLYAKREMEEGFQFEADTPWQHEFEDAFPFEETPDQLSAIEQIKADMEKPKPMDRLLCGDVGFGKTEVAIRAAFKAVMSGKQVAVLVPTTVLAQQHYQTFFGRFSGFGPVVDVISRFRSPKEQQETLARVARGQVDVLIGTHRLLQSDVKFHDLGFLIVDEEQRFGVAQKERLKKWSAGLDVLTLTATPIPRTLHMSLVGVRDISIIETPPEDRFPVQTYVVEYEDEIIRDAIRREMKRGGQVYYVYNRIQTIDKIYRQLTDMLPDAKIRVAHGQMQEDMLEETMLDFYEGSFDVLICTSIIENGLDIPNANTIIIHDSDKFGLSQLYQMRGRVGRSHRLAFAYFTYRRDKVLTEVAEKRLQAIKEFAELGAGFKIAMRDLEIRGAGNILGSQQHGHIIDVGFEMYCKLLEEAVEELKTGKPVELVPEPILEIQVEAYLPGDYISDAMHKIEIYQRFASVRNEDQIRELIDELVDRFGDPPQPVLNLLTVARIRNIARQLGVHSVIEHPGRVDIIFSDKPKVAVESVLQLQKQFPARIVIKSGPPEMIQYKTLRLTKPILDYLLKVFNVLKVRNDETGI